MSLTTSIFIFVLSVPTFSFASQKLTFGRFHSRAIFTQSASCNSPLVILIPGSGQNGPEEMMPSSMTADGRDHSVFASFSAGLLRGNVSTLAIGKPGIEFFKSWQPKEWYYNESLYKNLSWQNMLENVADAVALAKTLPCVDPNRIALLGHSEGTMVATDFAERNPGVIKSLILVGYYGDPLADIISWQLFKKPLDLWIIPDVDANHDGFVTQAEANRWPKDFRWTWTSPNQRASIAEIESALKAEPSAIAFFKLGEDASVWKEIFHRPARYEVTARFPGDLFVFNGALDVQTPPEQALRLKNACAHAGKRNCFVELIPGLGHAMSAPRAPRRHRVVDATLGPVDARFLQVLEKTAAMLRR